MLPILACTLIFVAVVAIIYYLLRRLERPRRTDRGFRPELEYLTERIVPSTTHYWTDASGDGKASTAANWTGGAFAAGDRLVLDSTNAPHSNDGVTFDIAPTDANGAPLLADLQVLANYTGQLHFTNSPTFTDSFEDDSAGAGPAFWRNDHGAQFLPDSAQILAARSQPGTPVPEAWCTSAAGPTLPA